MSQLDERPSEGAEPGSESTLAEAKETVQERTGQAVEEARMQMSRATGRVKQSVDERSTAAGRGAGSVGRALRESGERLRSQGKETEASLTEQAAGVAARLGRYLEDADADRMVNELEAFGRRRPWLLAVGGATLGFLGARVLKASADRRSGEGGDRGGGPGSAGSLTAGPRSGYHGVSGGGVTG